MSEEFGRLDDVLVREAWLNEARDFTPWLADNLDRIGEAVGLNLELLGLEKALPTADDYFSADIVARVPADDSVVLIENQLEKSDHTHLGQIMTYLAGLEAKTIIWIAPAFREAHLAAVRWLNEHTTEDFSFFAIKLRVVRIANSPMAPLFDVIEQPNQWERRLQTQVRAAKTDNPLGLARLRFWEKYFDLFPPKGDEEGPSKLSVNWRICCNGSIAVSYYLSSDRVGVFVRGLRGEAVEDFEERFQPIADRIQHSLKPEKLRTANGWFLPDSISGEFSDDTEFARLSQWLSARVDEYVAAIESAGC